MQVMQEAKPTLNSFDLSPKKKDANTVIQVHPFELICSLMSVKHLQTPSAKNYFTQ